MQTLWQRFKAGTQIIGDFQARLILSLLYLIFVLPIGLLARLGGNPLAPSTKSSPNSFWLPRQPQDENLGAARRQS